MAIYQISEDQLVPASATTFSAENIHERKHIQQLLKANIAALDESLMVIAEEFGEWIDSSRRIDLLCIDTDANLVVVELKRTEDGGHMELQAIRYAAMISQMTFEQLVETHGRYRNAAQPDLDGARTAILEFLGWDEVRENEFGQDTRIVLASANFSKELTTAVIWLRDRGIDVRCVRLQPYRLGDSGPILVDIQPIIPIPETSAFQTKIGTKRQAERQNLSDRHQLRFEFWETLLSKARERTNLHANVAPGTGTWRGAGFGKRGFSLGYTIREKECVTTLWISDNKAAFRQLLGQRENIERDFGGDLEWDSGPDMKACAIYHTMAGGYRSHPEEVPAIQDQMIDAMVRLEKAVKGRVLALKV